MEKTVGMRIKEQRMRLHMTQEYLAEVMHVPKSTISAYENDKVDIKNSVIIELCHHLRTEPNYLLGFQEYEKSEEEEYIDAVVVMLNRIKDRKMREVLFKQIEVIEEFS